MMASRAKGQLEFPSWLQSVDPNPYIARFCSSWRKRFRPTKMEELYEAVDLANFYVALGRPDDAERLLNWVVGLVEFGGNYNVWCPAGAGRMLLARLTRIRGDSKARTLALAPVRDQTYNVMPREELLAEQIAKHDNELAAAAASSRKWACQGLSRHLMQLHLLREESLAKFEHAVAPRETAELEPMIDSAYEALRLRLK
jgi:hypothetical protein